MESSHNTGTKNRLLSIVDDVDLIIRQLFETLSQQSSNKESASMETQSDTFKMNAAQLMDLLIQKNNSLVELTSTAKKQQKLQQQIELLRVEIAHQDEIIGCLQKRLKEAEHLLASALYQAKESLRLFDRASNGSVKSEDVIKYAHQISASCSTAAPLNWMPGDPRRPYPQDIQMRCGWLGQISNMPNAGLDGEVKPPPQLGTDSIQMPKFSQVDSRWQQNSSDFPMFNMVKSNDEIDVMSSDSSTSDSSESSFGND